MTGIDPAGEDRDPTVIAHLLKLHLDEPLPSGICIGPAVLKGDLGESQRIQKPVLGSSEKLRSLEVAAMAIVIR